MAPDRDWHGVIFARPVPSAITVQPVEQTLLRVTALALDCEAALA
jgi:hypothetical protein